jgi:phage terminase large subunit
MIDDNELKSLEWFAELSRTNNKAFMPLFADKSRFLVMKGGAGSGKSIAAGRKILERVINEPGHRWLIVRKISATLDETCFVQLLGQIDEHYPHEVPIVNRASKKISFKNGSELIFKGLDDVEKLKSIYNISGIWIEEATEVLQSDFAQLDIRLRPPEQFQPQIIISFNPISSTHWLKREFFDRRADDEVTFRDEHRTCYVRKENVKVPQDNGEFTDKVVERSYTLHETTHLDNKYVEPWYRATLMSYKETDPYYYDVYCMGKWGTVGRGVFDNEIVSKRLENAPKPIMKGDFDIEIDELTISNYKWQEDAQGYIKVYKKPNKFHTYVIGGDTAGMGSDYFVAHVIDNITGEQVAVLRHQFDEDLFTQQVYALGKWYNNALIGLESNFSTYPVMMLEKYGYTKQYVRKREDTYQTRFAPSYGFKTTMQSRNRIVSNLIQFVREDADLINDIETLTEMLSFVRNDSGRPEAMKGAHDDCVISLAIAHDIRSQQTEEVAANMKVSQKGWSDFMRDQFADADQPTRKELLKLWEFENDEKDA